MGSEPDLNAETQSRGTEISRDGSYFSLNSATSSTYFTAKEDLTSSTSTGLYATPYTSTELTTDGINQDIPHASSLGDDNSSTVEEVDSLSATSSLGVDDQRPHSVESSESSTLEVREDISRLCNAIAESDSIDLRKRENIEQALKFDNLKRLRDLAVSTGGLLSNSLRTRAWPLLLNVSPLDIANSECRKIPNYFPDVPEKICNLVHLDVARVLKRFPPGLTDPQQDHLQVYLTNIICSVLQQNKSAYYYQGFHDISLTFLLVSISQNVPYLSYLCLNKMIQSNLEPYMEKTMDSTHDLIHVLFAIIEKEDRSLYDKIVVACRCPIAFCLPWVLTWFAHTLPNDTDVFRLYDFILGAQNKLKYPYLIPVFVSAALLLYHAEKVKKNPDLVDMPSMHHAVSKLPTQTQLQEEWLKESLCLIERYAGKEDVLLQRGIEIKALQNRLWSELPGENKKAMSRRRTNDGLLMTFSRYLFVTHRWTTVTLVILGAAVLLQGKYGRSVTKLAPLRSIIQTYAPEPVQSILVRFLAEDPGDE